ncbi:vacuolar protein sorting-associated protein 51-like protein [Vairimorpha necatrix]|uniref:Vacuolar protein sorting-associated protein 51-like protein n=1 Tax=Vairimorpha necatrix TaxID=6039 RepID=A0AAX4J9Y8_9MICR
MQNEEEKKILNKDFDVLNVINKTYADSSEYDLNDTLIYLSKVLTSTKAKNKELVKSNFSKFVECRIVLEEILEDMKSKGLDKDFSSDIFTNIKYVKSNFKPINKEDDIYKERKLMIINKYKTLFNIKKLLEMNIRKYERFVEIYKEGKRQFNELKNSKFVQSLLESIKDIKIEFLEILYNEIIDDKNNYMEILYYFDLYFQVSEDKTDRKIMNTLLVSFKEKCLDVGFTNKGLYLKDINYYFLRTIIHLDKELQKELIIYIFERIKLIFENSNFDFIKIWIFKYTNFIPDFLDLEVKSVYEVHLRNLKKCVISKFLDRNNLYESFVRVSTILNDDELQMLNHKLLKIVEDKSKNILFDRSEDIEEYFRELDKFDEFLKDDLEEFQELKRKILNGALRQKIKNLGMFLEKTVNKHKKMMEIVRTIDKLPDWYEIILKGILPVLERDKAILYFVSFITKTERPNLNNLEKNEIETLSGQFGFLTK